MLKSEDRGPSVKTAKGAVRLGLYVGGLMLRLLAGMDGRAAPTASSPRFEGRLNNLGQELPMPVAARVKSGIVYPLVFSLFGGSVLNKAELVDIVAKGAGTTKKDAENIINITMATIVQEVASGGHVTLVGFGTFESRKRNARTVRNPRTQEPLSIPAKIVAGFKVGKDFAEAVNQKNR